MLPVKNNFAEVEGLGSIIIYHSVKQSFSLLRILLLLLLLLRFVIRLCARVSACVVSHT